MNRKPFHITRSCPFSPEVRQVGEWCIIAGHWVDYSQGLGSRTIDESVMIFCVDGARRLRLRGLRTLIKVLNKLPFS